MKYLSTPIDPHRGVDFVTECVPCRTTVRGPQCTLCKRLLLNCVICRVVVKGKIVNYYVNRHIYMSIMGYITHFQALQVFVSCAVMVDMADACRTGSQKRSNVQQDVVVIVCWKIILYFPFDDLNTSSLFDKTIFKNYTTERNLIGKLPTSGSTWIHIVLTLYSADLFKVENEAKDSHLKPIGTTPLQTLEDFK